MCSCPLWDEDHIWLEQDRDFDEDEEDEDEDDEYYDSDSDYYWTNIFPSTTPLPFSLLSSFQLLAHKSRIFSFHIWLGTMKESMKNGWAKQKVNLKETD